jgi:hypothetical protein
MSGEVTWRQVREFPNYRVSDHGDVDSRRRSGARGGLLKQTKAIVSGYLMVHFSDGSRTRFVAVHVAVAEAFLGPRPEGLQIRHLNGLQEDNRAANLAYGTQSENELDKVIHGTNRNASKTHCKRGHEFTPDNIYVPPGRNARLCRRCRAIRSAQTAAKLREK